MMELFLEVVPITLLVGTVYGLFRRRTLLRRGEGWHWRQEAPRLLLVCYLTGLFNLVLVPANLWSGIWYFLRWGWFGTGLAPLFSGEFQLIPTGLRVLRGELTVDSWVRTMLVGNVLMFLPMGVLVPPVFPGLRMRDSWKLALAVPLGIELLQPIIGRSFDVDDLLMNALGILVSFPLGCLLRKKL